MSDEDWWRRAKCVDADPDAPFGPAEVARRFIRKFCDYCPVRAECLQFSVKFDGPGVYGGMTHRDRAKRGQVAGQRARPPCGTIGGYSSHVRHKEDPCERCLAAKREYYAARRRLRAS